MILTYLSGIKCTFENPNCISERTGEIYFLNYGIYK